MNFNETDFAEPQKFTESDFSPKQFSEDDFAEKATPAAATKPEQFDIKLSPQQEAYMASVKSGNPVSDPQEVGHADFLISMAKSARHGFPEFQKLASDVSRSIPADVAAGLEILKKPEGVTNDSTLSEKWNGIIQNAKDSGQFSGNILAALRNEPLPIDEALRLASEDAPTAATIGKISQGIAGTAPLLVIGGLPKLAQKIVLTAFTADMLHKAPQTATELGAELGKPVEEQNHDKITSLISEGIQEVGFGALGGAHLAGGLLDKYIKSPVEKMTEPIAESNAPQTAEALKEVLTGVDLKMPEGANPTMSPPIDIPVKAVEEKFVQPSLEKSDLGAGAATTPQEPLKVTTPKAEQQLRSYTVELLDEDGKSVTSGNIKHHLVGQDATSPEEALQLVKDSYGKQFPGETPNLKIFSENEPIQKSTIVQSALEKSEGERTKEDLIKARIKSGIKPENIRITVQADNEVPGSGFVQVDEINKETGENHFSSNPEQLKALGLDIPTTEELKKLPQGKYSLSEATEKLSTPSPKSVVREETQSPPVKAKEGEIEPFQPDEELIMRSPHTGDDTVISYRGKPEEGQAVVWTGKMQMQIPESWLRRKGEEYVKPDEKPGTGVLESSGKKSESQGGSAVTPVSPESLSKSGLVDELAGKMPSDYSSKVKWEDLRKALGRFTKEELIRKVTNERESNAKFAELQSLTSELYPELEKLANDSGVKWRDALKQKAKSEGVEAYLNPSGTKSDAIYALAQKIASKRQSKPLPSDIKTGALGDTVKMTAEERLSALRAEAKKIASEIDARGGIEKVSNSTIEKDADLWKRHEENQSLWEAAHEDRKIESVPNMDSDSIIDDLVEYAVVHKTDSHAPYPRYVEALKKRAIELGIEGRVEKLYPKLSNEFSKSSINTGELGKEGGDTSTPKPPERTAKSLADKIRSLKVDPKGGKSFSLPHPDAIKAIGELAWNGALEIAANIVEKGGSIKTAIEAALSHLRESGDGFSEMKLRANLRYGLGEDGGDKSVTGLAERVREQREQSGMTEPTTPGQGIAPEASVKRGRQLVDNGADPEATMQEFEKTQRASSDDFAIARARTEELARATNQAESVHGRDSQEFKDAFKAESDWAKRTKAMQTEWAKAGHAQQGEVDIDTGTFSGLARAYKEVTGRDFNDEQAKKADEHSKKVSEAEKKVEEAKPKLDTAINQIGEPVEPHVRLLADRLKKYFRSQADDALAEIRKRRAEGRLFSGLDPTEIAPYAKYGAAKIFEKGIEGSEMAADWAKEMLDEVGDFIQPHLKAIWDASREFLDKGINKLASDSGLASKVKEATKRKPATAETIQDQQKLFHDYESGKPMSQEQVKALWTRAKSYIDKGEENFGDIVNNVSDDLGISPKDTLKGFNQNRNVRRVADDVWQKQRQARLLKAAAKRWVNNANETWLAKAFPVAARLAFSAKTGLHGTVALGTHAPLVTFTHPVVFADNFGKMYKLVASPDYYQMQASELARRPNYTVAQRAGLVNDMAKMEDFNDPRLAQGFPKMADWFKKNLDKANLGRVVGMGTRGYSVLKILRQDLFDHEWNQLADSHQTPEMATAIADSVNHMTGVVKTGSNPAASYALFAPKLELSRLAVLGRDPAIAVNNLLKMKDMTPEERWFAKNQFKEKAKILGVWAGLLVANQTLNNLFSDDQKINGVPESLGGAGFDPMKSDFMKFKMGGMNFSWAGPFMTMMRLPFRILRIGFGDGGKSKHLIYPDESMGYEALKYLRSQGSPISQPVVSIITKADYEGRPLPQIPGYGAPPPVPKRLAAQGVKPYTWNEFIQRTVLPIPFEEAAKEVFHNMGVEDKDSSEYLKALTTIIIMGGTGGRLSEDWEKKK